MEYTEDAEQLRAAIFVDKEKVGLGSSASDTGKGKSKVSKNITHGYDLVKGKSSHPMEDYVVAEFKQVDDHELGLFAIFDGHLSHDIPNYLWSHLFVNILNEIQFYLCAPTNCYATWSWIPISSWVKLFLLSILSESILYGSTRSSSYL